SSERLCTESQPARSPMVHPPAAPCEPGDGECPLPWVSGVSGARYAHSETPEAPSGSGVAGQGLDPAAGRGRQRVGTGGAPGGAAVGLDGRRVLEHGPDDAPLLLDAVGPTEAAVVALHRVLQQPLVGLAAVGVAAVRADRQ